MAIRTFGVAKFTTEAVADATNYTDNKYMALKGGSSTQVTKLKEIFTAGLEPTTSSPQVLITAFDSTVGATLTGLTTGQSDTPDHPSASALSSPVLPFTASTTKPQRGTSYIAQPEFNALGGLVRIRYPYGEEPVMVGNAANAGEISLSGFTGTTPALIGGQLKYETV